MTCPPSEDIIRQVRRQCPKIMLSFSRGKDAIGAFLAIRDHFDEIVPYHLYLVPGLEFVEESLAYYERIIGRKIWNMPHPTFYKQLNSFIFHPPSHAAVIAAANLPNFSYADVHRMIAEAEGLPDSALVASGVRAADSPIRKIAFQTHGAISVSRRQFYPIWDWNKARLLETISASGIKLPVDYLWFGRSFDGIDLRFLAPLKKHAPADYRRVLEWFPLADLEVWRYERSLAA